MTGNPESVAADKAGLLKLAARAKDGAGSDRFLDADVHELLFGTVNAAPVGLTYRDAFDRLRGLSSPYHFTGYVDGGAEMALPGPEWPEYQITRRFATGYHASVATGEDNVGCETAARALLHAALIARAFATQGDTA